jgi:hypothetical protein
MRRVSPCLAVLALCVSCAPLTAEQRSYDVRVRVDSDPGEGIPNVPIQLGSARVGVTNTEGTALVHLLGREGQRMPLEAACPSTHNPPEEPAVVVLRTYANAATPELAISCSPRTRKLAVVVKAKNGADLDIVHRGKTIGRTDDEGSAHLLLEGPPGDVFEVALDTESRPDLHPANPGGRFVITSKDDAMLFDPELEVAAPPPARKHHHKAPVHKGPTRIR